jgi:hypothetical protein
MSDFLSEPFNLLEKAKYEFDEAKAAKSEKLASYSIFNVAITINHLFEWVLYYDHYDTNTKKICVNKFNPYIDKEQIPNDFKLYYDTVNFPKTNVEQRLIRKISNGFKHFKVQAEFNIEEKKHYIGCGFPSMDAGNEKAVCGYYESYHFEIEYRGIKRNVCIILEQLIGQWDDFFNSSLSSVMSQTDCEIIDTDLGCDLKPKNLSLLGVW